MKVVFAPLHITVLLALKSAFRAHPCKVTARVLCVPEQPVAKDSTTPMLPLLVPKLTVIELLFGPVAPDTMDAPAGTVHA